MTSASALRARRCTQEVREEDIICIRTTVLSGNAVAKKKKGGDVSLRDTGRGAALETPF